MNAEEKVMRAKREKGSTSIPLNDHTELLLDGTLYRVSCAFSDSGQLPDLLDALILEKISRGG